MIIWHTSTKLIFWCLIEGFKPERPNLPLGKNEISGWFTTDGRVNREVWSKRVNIALHIHLPIVSGWGLQREQSCMWKVYQRCIYFHNKFLWLMILLYFLTQNMSNLCKSELRKCWAVSVLTLLLRVKPPLFFSLSFTLSPPSLSFNFLSCFVSCS